MDELLGTHKISEQIEGSWHERAGRKMLLEDWIDVWVGMLGDIGPKTRAKYKYVVEVHPSGIPRARARVPGVRGNRDLGERNPHPHQRPGNARTHGR